MSNKLLSRYMGNKLEKYLFMQPFLLLLQKGGFFTRMVSVMLRVLAALVVLGSLASFFKAGKVIFDLPTSGIMGGIMFQIFYILAIYAVAHILIIRSRDIEQQKDKEYYMLPVAALLTRLTGEAYAAYVAINAVGGGIYVWFTGKPIGTIMSPMPFLFPTPQKPDFMGGIELILGGILLATGAIIVSYVTAELLTALERATFQSKVQDRNGPREINENHTPNHSQSRFG